MNYTVDGMEQHTAEVLTLLKRKEERLQIEVNKCAELRKENLMLTKQLQVRAIQLLPECCLVLHHCCSANASSRTPAAFPACIAHLLMPAGNGKLYDKPSLVAGVQYQQTA